MNKWEKQKGEKIQWCESLPETWDRDNRKGYERAITIVGLTNKTGNQKKREIKHRGKGRPEIEASQK